MKFKIGIIGKGFVGNAVASGFSQDHDIDSSIKIYDVNPELSTHSLDETVNDSDFIFLSVPTPAFEDGSIDLTIVDNALKSIEEVINVDNIVLIRSTVVPGTSAFFQKKFQQLNIVFNPEFLTERNAVKDFINQDRIILGGDERNVAKVANLYNNRFPGTEIVETDYQTAELIKYMNNLFFATKVSFMNEMKILSNHVNADWATAIKGFTLDERVGQSHNDVPGPDGKFGFGGSCFPKDIQALIQFSESMGIDMRVLKAAWETNLNVRPEKDWENLKGRAVSIKKDG